MAGIYIHIPYCKQACYYCDFHFSTNINTKSDLIDAIVKEIDLQEHFLKGEQVETIYFGGGTPSLLSRLELAAILERIYATFNVSSQTELTIECNPDDINDDSLADISALGFNRLSIGIQSFDDKILKYFNRAHTANMATNAVQKAQAVGFDNISIDLIFGVPNQSVEDIAIELQKAIKLNTQHVSIYGLTIEDHTVFGTWKKQKKLIPLDDEIAGEQLSLITRELSKAGFIQYEIASFCKLGHESKHNSSYWSGKKYLGLGPAAHSYDGTIRQFNIRNNPKYIKEIQSGHLPCEVEILSREDQINETILTKIRLIDGIPLDELKHKLQFDLLVVQQAAIKELKSFDMIILSDNRLKLTEKGKLLADFITEKLII